MSLGWVLIFRGREMSMKGTNRAYYFGMELSEDPLNKDCGTQ